MPRSKVKPASFTTPLHRFYRPQLTPPNHRHPHNPRPHPPTRRLRTCPPRGRRDTHPPRPNTSIRALRLKSEARTSLAGKTCTGTSPLRASSIHFLSTLFPTNHIRNLDQRPTSNARAKPRPCCTRALFPQLLHLARRARDIPRRPLCHACLPATRLRHSPARGFGTRSVGYKRWEIGMERVEVESAQY
jgi:hypothetical protein